MVAKETLNPFDVEGLEQSLSDSATRVSAIWISYLLFGLYLLVTAGTATNKQLLLADPVKLPALGIEVPLVSFSVLSPVLFVLLQFYVLLQTLLLGRTARAYDDALNRTLKKPQENALFRERLANTIFAQIFAGAPRERAGWVGSVLRGITWFTLIGSPILVLLTFQIAFLPYHSEEVTWTHRLLIYAEVAMVFTIWPAVINPAKEFAWYRLDFRFWRSNLWSRRQFGRIAAIFLVLFSTFALSFPGEYHINLLSFRSLESRSCDRWLPLGLDKWIVIDRLVLKDVGIVDPKTFKEMNDDAPPKVPMYDGARSKDLSGRDFVCGQFDGVDFRRAALEGAHFEGSFLVKARLEGAKLTGAFLQDANLNGAVINKVTFRGANLRRAELSRATLSEVDLGFANLAGIDLSEATFTDVTFEKEAILSGANLIGLKTTDGTVLKLPMAHLEGASLQYAELPNIDLRNAILDGADLYGAKMPGAKLQDASLVGVFQTWPQDWGTHPDEQRNFAKIVADTVCSPSSPEKQSVLNNNRSEIVAAIVQNALYPRRDDPACIQTETISDQNPSCPAEQPKEYRTALAEQLNKCASKILGPDDDNNLRSGIYNGHAARTR